VREGAGSPIGTLMTRFSDLSSSPTKMTSRGSGRVVRIDVLLNRTVDVAVRNTPAARLRSDSMTTLGCARPPWTCRGCDFGLNLAPIGFGKASPDLLSAIAQKPQAKLGRKPP